MKLALRVILLLIVSILTMSNVMASKLKNNTFYGKFGYSISICSDTLNIYSLFSPYCEKPTAVCKYKRIRDNFIEINTLNNLSQEVFKEMSITQYGDTVSILDFWKNRNNGHQDSLTIFFSFPNYNSELDIEVSSNFKYYTSKVVDHTAIFKIPKQLFEINLYFTIFPNKYHESLPFGLFLGRLYYDYELPQKVRGDSISIEIPNLTDDSFIQFEIQGEYIEVQPNLDNPQKLIWRGYEFTKEE